MMSQPDVDVVVDCVAIATAAGADDQLWRGGQCCRRAG